MKIVIGSGTIAKAIPADIRLHRPYFDAATGRVTDIYPLQAGDVVYLAFGASNPNRCFAHPLETRNVNVVASRRIISEVIDAGATPVFFSSEMVFDGEQGGYTEDSPPHPMTEYGRQKAEVETFLRLYRFPWLVVRMGSIVSLGAGENCVVEKTYASLNTGFAKMAHDNKMTVTPLAEAVPQLMELSDPGIYHLVGCRMSRFELAGKILATAASKCAFSSAPHSEIDYPEPRPRLSFLESTRINTINGTFAAIENKVKLLDALA